MVIPFYGEWAVAGDVSYRKQYEPGFIWKLKYERGFANKYCPIYEIVAFKLDYLNFLLNCGDDTLTTLFKWCFGITKCKVFVCINGWENGCLSFK